MTHGSCRRVLHVAQAVAFYPTSEVRTVNYKVRPAPIVPNGVILAVLAPYKYG